MKRKPLIIGAAVASFLVALGITLYPLVSNAYNKAHQSQIHTSYQEQLQQADNTAILEAKELATAYNNALKPGVQPVDAFSQNALLWASEDYDQQLDITGSGIMGYIHIPKINVYLPIYHDTDSDSLGRGVGHLLGSSLPVGGESTHAILTGHSGVASQKLFTDLPQLKQGDVFYLHVLDEVLAYQVEEINTVLPYDTSHLGISQGQDCCTLITCTPIGINTHRLLVRGIRIPYEEAETVQEAVQNQQPETVSNWEDQYMLGIWFGILGAVLMALAAVLRKWFPSWVRRSGRGKYVK